MGKLTIPSGSTLISNGTTATAILTLAFSAGAVNPIAGRLEINNTTIANAINFNNSVTTVTGTFALGGSIAAGLTSGTTTLLMNGTYEHKYTTISGTIPTATWADGSNCNIIGYTATVLAHPSYGQSFWNFTWNCPSQTTAITGAIATAWIVRNNLTLTSTGSGSFINSGTNTYAIKNIIMSGGTFNLGGGAGIYTITGDFTKTGGTMTPSAACTFNFAGTTAQALTLDALAANAATWRFSNAAGVTITGTGSFPTSFPIGNATLGGVRISTTAAPITFAGTITNGFAYNALLSTLTYDAAGSFTARAIEFPATSGPANLTINTGSSNNVVTMPFSRTVRTTLTMTSGDIDISSNTLTLGTAGTSVALAGTLSWTAGSVRVSTGSMTRWFPTTGLPTAAGTTIGYFPIANGANNRNASVYFNTTTALTTGGTITVSHNATGGLAALSPTLTETQVMDKRTNATWTFAQSGLVAGGTIAFRLTSGNLVTSATPANLHVILATPALAPNVHVAGAGTNPNLTVARSGLSVANLANTFAIGAASADMLPVFNSVASGNWGTASTWDANAVPTSTDVVNISQGTNVTLDGANVASTLTIQAGATLTAAANSLTATTTITNNGTMNVSGGTVTATGASTTGITNSAAATMTINGGTVTVGPAGGSFRRFTNLGTLTVSSGTLNVNGNFVNTSSAGNIFTQSGGNINIDGNAAGVTANSVATGVALAAFTTGTPTTVFFTGGTFTIVDPHANTGASDHAFSGSMSTATNCNINHIFRFGDGVSTDAGGSATNGFSISSSTLVLGNVVANGGTGTNRFATTASVVGILGDLTINANSEYRIGTSANHITGNIVNNGTLTNANTITLGSFAGAVAAASTNAQTISGSGIFRNSTTTTTASMASLTVNNSNATGITLNTPLSISGTFTLTLGLVNTTTANLLTLGTATAGATFSGFVGTTNHIVGPLARTFVVSRATGTYVAFHTGKGGSYLPISIDLSTAATGPVIVTAEAFTTNSGTSGAGVSNLSTKTWTATATTGAANMLTANVRVQDVAVTATSKLLHSATIGGTYAGTPGGSVAVAGTTVSTSAPIAVADYLGNFAYGDLVACTAPTDAPTDFTKNLVTTTTFTGGFTAATSNPTGYLVVRYPTGATPVAPADNTLYAAAATLGTGTVLNNYYTAPFSFNVTGLTANTTYDYYVYAFNNSGCAGPVYFSTPLMGSVTTCATSTGTPGTPTATLITSSGFTASWTTSSTSGVDYELDVSTNNTFTALLSGYPKNVGIGTLTYAVTGLSPTTTYYTRVRAFTGTCYSASSSTLTTLTVAVPTITSLSPNVCNGPATLTITGTGLTGATAVTVGGTPVTAILTNTATSITATVAAGTSGTVEVTNPGGVITSATSYAVSALGVVTVTPSVASLCGTGGTTDLVASSPYGSYTYAWTSLTAGASLSAASGTTSTATLTATSDFQLLASDAGTGCTETVVTSIGVYPFPSTTMTATPNDTICAGSTVTLNSGLSAGNFSYSTITYGNRTAPTSAVNLATNGAAVVTQSGTASLDDGGWGAIPIGFNFNFFGTTYTSINVGTNGTLQFGAFNNNDGLTAPRGLADYAFTTLPSTTEPFNVVAVCANDNHLTTLGANGGTVRYWTTGYAPNRIFVVEYLAVRQYNTSGTTNTSTAQAHFFETTGIVEVHVQGSTSSNNKLVGLQNGDGTVGAIALATTAAITTPVAYRFSPPSNYTTTWTPTATLTAPTSGSNIFTVVATPTAPTTTYSLTFTNTVTGCTNSATPATIAVTVLPTPVSAVASSPTICSGLTATLTNTATLGATDTVRWYSALTGGTALATGNTFTTPALTATTTYYAETNNVACVNAGGRVAVPVNISAAPVAQTLTGGGGYCVGGSGVDVGVTTTETGVDYQLRLDGTATGSPVAGTGAAISLGTQTTSGTYTVLATNATGCTAVMTGNKVVSVNAPASTAVLTSSAANTCATMPINLNVAITGGTSPFAVVYSDGANQTVNSYITGANIPVAILNTTNYSLVSVTDANGCVATTPSGAPSVTVDQVPTASVAGSAQSAATTAFTLAGNTPSVGTGIWTLVSGDAGIVTPLSATSAVSMPVGTATLRWSITNGVCAASSSDVVLTSTVPVANASTTSACQAFTSVTIDATNNNVWVPLLENGAIVAAIKANGNNLGTVSGSYFINGSGTIRATGNGAKYMDRNVGISTTTPPSSTVSVRMYLTTAEWAALVAAVPAVADNAFSLARLSGTCNTAYTNSGTIINGASIVDINGYRAIQFSTSQFSDFYVTESNAVLPIELKSFTASVKGTTNSVKWTTATEENVAEFIIERSANGRDAWTAIARTKAAGTSLTEQNYHVTDNEPLTLSYYRLRNVDMSGKSEVSKTVAVKRNGGKLAVLMVSPNPTTEGVNVDFSTSKIGKLNVSVIDILGKVVKSETVTTVEGSNLMRLDVSNLAQGTYLLTLNDGETIATQRVVKQ